MTTAHLQADSPVPPSADPLLAVLHQVGVSSEVTRTLVVSEDAQAAWLRLTSDQRVLFRRQLRRWVEAAANNREAIKLYAAQFLAAIDVVQKPPPMEQVGGRHYWTFTTDGSGATASIDGNTCDCTCPGYEALMMCSHTVAALLLSIAPAQPLPSATTG